MTPAAILTRWLSDDAERRGIVVKYCAVETELPLEIVKVRQLLLEALEMSRRQPVFEPKRACSSMRHASCVTLRLYPSINRRL